MVRLRNSLSGVVVQVDEATAERLPSTYKPATERTRGRKPRKDADESDD